MLRFFFIFDHFQFEISQFYKHGESLCQSVNIRRKKKV